MDNIEKKNPKQNPISLGQTNLASLLNLSLQGANGRKKLDFIYFTAANTNEIDPSTHNAVLVVGSTVSFARKRQAKEKTKKLRDWASSLGSFIKFTFTHFSS